MTIKEISCDCSAPAENQISQRAWADEETEAFRTKHTKKYDQLRAEEYPPIGDQLDAIWKALEHMKINGVELPVETVEMLDDQILSVKAKYPKPTKGDDNEVSTGF